MDKYIDWKPGIHMRPSYTAYTHALLELCNITINSLIALDMDDEWIKSTTCELLGLPDYRTYHTPEGSWYILN